MSKCCNKDQNETESQIVKSKSKSSTFTATKSYKNKILLFGIVIVISAIVAFVIAFTRTNNYDESQEQFSGEIQLERTREEIIEWHDDFVDINSPQAKALVDKIKPKITAALESEGFNLDKVEITALEPDEKIDVTLLKNTKNEVIDERFFQGRAVEVENDINFKTYKDVQSVKVKVKTYGSPVKNAAVMGSAGSDPQTWGQVGNAVSARLRSVGLNTRVKEIQPQQDFIYTVSQVIQYQPLAVTTTEAPKAKIFEANCLTTVGKAHIIQAEQNQKYYFHCTSICKKPYYEVAGGTDNMFHSWEFLCTLAWAVGFSTEEGEGLLEVIEQGAQWLVPMNRTIRKADWLGKRTDTRFYQYTAIVKSVGPVITPTTPPPPTLGIIHPFFPSLFIHPTTTTNMWVEPTPTPTTKVGIQSVGNPKTMMVLFNDLYNPLWPKKRENPSIFYSSDHEDSIRYRKDVIDRILNYLEKKGFYSVKDEGLYPALNEENRIAFFITINDDAENFVQVIKTLDSLEWGNFYVQMYKDLKVNTKRFLGSVRLTKKGKEALEKYDNSL